MRSRSITRRAWCGLVLVAVAPVAARAGARPLVPGDAFVTIDAESIAGRRVVLPADSNGAPFVAIFGFSRRAGEATAQWGDALAKALPPDRAIYAVADLSRIPGIIRGFVIAGIRKAASPTPPDDRNRVLLLTRRNEWSRIVPGGSDDDAVIVAVDASGSISYIERRPFSAHAAKDVAEAIASRP